MSAIQPNPVLASQTSCRICLEEYSEHQFKSIHVLPCNHSLHLMCAKKILESGNDKCLYRCGDIGKLPELSINEQYSIKYEEGYSLNPSCTSYLLGSTCVASAVFPIATETLTVIASAVSSLPITAVAATILIPIGITTIVMSDGGFSARLKETFKATSSMIGTTVATGLAVASAVCVRVGAEILLNQLPKFVNNVDDFMGAYGRSKSTMALFIVAAGAFTAIEVFDRSAKALNNFNRPAIGSLYGTVAVIKGIGNSILRRFIP